MRNVKVFTLLALALSTVSPGAQFPKLQVSATPQAQSTNTIAEFISTTKASKPCPTMTTTQRDAIGSPSLGQCITNSTTSLFNFYNGSAWTSLTTGTPAIYILKSQSFNVSGTFTTDANTTTVLLCGAGGGGGGGGGGLASAATGGWGGGGAATSCESRIVTVSTAYTVTIGAGGAGGAAGADGSTGASTTFGALATFYGAQGGRGGTASAAITAALVLNYLVGKGTTEIAAGNGVGGGGRGGYGVVDSAIQTEFSTGIRSQFALGGAGGTSGAHGAGGGGGGGDMAGGAGGAGNSPANPGAAGTEGGGGGGGSGNTGGSGAAGGAGGGGKLTVYWVAT